jgi:GntR family transcriptional regulator/MocR family aminotransferase
MLDTADWLNTPEWTARLTPQHPHALSKVRQLYLALYEAITRGELADQQQLPSSRQLACQLGLGRNTVIAAYAQLHDEGLIFASGRRGTRVQHQPHFIANESIHRSAFDDTTELTLPSLSRRCNQAPPLFEDSHAKSNKQTQPYTAKKPHPARTNLTRQHADLAPGMPDPSLFPPADWRRALNAASRLPSEHLGYQYRPLAHLQEALARYLAIYRSLMVAPEQIIITSGTRQSLALAAAMYSDPGDLAWVESPGYPGAVDAFKMHALKLRALPVDNEGCHINVAASAKPPALIYLTPCFQYPTGVALSATRRAQLLHYANQHHCMIFEDDYDSEFRDDSQARPALASQQSPGSSTVLHAGTFSKLIFPAARIAWLVVPMQHIDHAHHCLRALGGGHNTIAQATVAEIVNNGSLAKHLQRARGIYAQRRRMLLDALDTTGFFYPLCDTGGSLSLVAHLNRPVSYGPLVTTMDSQRLGAVCLEDLQWDTPHTERAQALVLGLGNVSTMNIPATVDRLAQVLKSATV